MKPLNFKEANEEETEWMQMYQNYMSNFIRTGNPNDWTGQGSKIKILQVGQVFTFFLASTNDLAISKLKSEGFFIRWRASLEAVEFPIPGSFDSDSISLTSSFGK